MLQQLQEKILVVHADIGDGRFCMCKTAALFWL